MKYYKKDPDGYLLQLKHLMRKLQYWQMIQGMKFPS